MQKLLLLTLLIPGIIPSQIQTGSISGQVRVADGTPVAGVEIIVTSASLVGPGAPALTGTARTDAAGRFTIPNIPPGDYHVIASLESRVYYPGVTKMADAKAITVKPGAVIDDIVFGALPRVDLNGTTFQLVTAGVKVNGRIAMAPGRPPLENGLLMMISDEPGSILEANALSPNVIFALVQPDSSFEFLAVPPGRYRIRVGGAGGVSVNAVTELVVGTTDLTNIEVTDRDWVRNSQGLQPVWSLDGPFTGIVWDSSASLLRVASGSSLAQVNTSGKLVDESAIGRWDASRLRLARLPDVGLALLAFSTWRSVTAYDLNGVALWTYSAGAVDDVWAADLDGDGLDEVIVGLNGAAGLHVVDGRGKLLWKDTSVGNRWYVTAADVRGTGKPQVLSTSSAGRVHIHDGAGKQIVTLTPGFSAYLLRAGKLSADDRNATIFVGTSRPDSDLTAMAGDGSPKWSLALRNFQAHSMYLAERKPWLAVAGQDGKVQVIDAQLGKVIASIDGQGTTPEIAWAEDKTMDAPLLVVTTGARLNAYRITPGK